MKKIFLILTVLLSTYTLSAQNWEPNFEQAKEKAQKESKDIILVFSGSDWCASCIKLDQNIFQSDVFKKYAKEHWILVKADFPRKKKNKLSKEQTAQNSALAEKYNPQGYFPSVLVLNAKGTIIGNTGYKKFSPEEYINHLKSLE